MEKESKHAELKNKQRATFFLLAVGTCTADSDGRETCLGNEQEDANWDPLVKKNVNIRIDSLTLKTRVLDCNLLAEQKRISLPWNINKVRGQSFFFVCNGSHLSFVADLQPGLTRRAFDKSRLNHQSLSSQIKMWKKSSCWWHQAWHSSLIPSWFNC